MNYQRLIIISGLSLILTSCSGKMKVEYQIEAEIQTERDEPEKGEE